MIIKKSNNNSSFNNLITKFESFNITDINNKDNFNPDKPIINEDKLKSELNNSIVDNDCSLDNDGNSKNVLFEGDSDKADEPNLEVEGDLFYERVLYLREMKVVLLMVIIIEFIII